MSAERERELDANEGVKNSVSLDTRAIRAYQEE